MDHFDVDRLIKEIQKATAALSRMADAMDTKPLVSAAERISARDMQRCESWHRFDAYTLQCMMRNHPEDICHTADVNINGELNVLLWLFSDGMSVFRPLVDLDNDPKAGTREWFEKQGVTFNPNTKERND